MYNNTKQWDKLARDEWRRSREPEELPEIKVDSVRQLIERFFSKLTSAEWDLLRVGQPDEATKFQLAELILNFIILLSNAILETLGRRHVAISEDQVRSILGDSIAQGFAQALDMTETVNCASSRNLTNLIVKEVCESVKSSLSAERDPDVQKKITPPKRLNKMVQHACKMLKKLIRSMKTLCRCMKQRPCSTKVTEIESEDKDDLEGTDSEDKSQSGPETSNVTSEQSEDSIMRTTTNVVQEIIAKEFQEISKPLFDDMEDLGLTEDNSSAEILAVSKDVAQSIIEEATSLAERDAVSPTPEKEKPKLSLTGVLEKVHTFFARSFAKMSIHRIWRELKRKFSQDSKVKSKESVKSLSDSIDSLISKVYMENLHDLTKAHLFPSLQDITKANTLLFTKELCELLYCFSTNGMMPEITPEPPYNREVQLNLFGEIQASVWCFLGLMRWWLSFQARTHSDRVVQALSENEQVVTLTNKGLDVVVLKLEDKENALFKETAVRILIEMLVTKLFYSAKVKYSIVKPETIIWRLFDKVWAEVNGADFKITPQNLHKIEKGISKDLDNKLGHGGLGLIFLDMENPEFENYLVTLFKTYMSPKRPCAVCRFFRTICSFFSKRRS